MYKVEFYTLGITKPSGKIGNIRQYKDIAYIDCPMADLQDELIQVTTIKYYYPVITKITKIDGFIIETKLK